MSRAWGREGLECVLRGTMIGAAQRWLIARSAVAHGGARRFDLRRGHWRAIAGRTALRALARGMASEHGWRT
jgi:hypothetical protein